METPNVWMEFGTYLHQDFVSCYDDLRYGIKEIFDGFEIAERQELKDYLAYLVSPERPPGTLKKAWLESAAQIIPAAKNGKEWKMWYTEIIDAISDDE